MSEEILKLLMELFAITVKRDGVVTANERNFVSDFLAKQLSGESASEYLAAFDKQAETQDSDKIFVICKKINESLTQPQKVVVLVRLCELINADNQFTPCRTDVINTVAEAFKVSAAELTDIKQFVKNNEPENLINLAILVLNPKNDDNSAQIYVLRVDSVDLYFVKYYSGERFYLNGLPVNAGQVYSFASGSSIKSQSGAQVYYSDVSSHFLSNILTRKISFTVENLSYKFENGEKAIENISFSVDEGKFIGIMGASGSGKTTLLNLISGILRPASGKIKINSLNIEENGKELEGVFGYVPQDDLLIEDLTVFENLYFAACQCFKNKGKEEITILVDRLLANLGLFEKRNLKVGSPLHRVISGGQRKRLNIALELIREPSVLFIDEPTGLSSRDSEHLMRLLHDLTLKGKLIFTVIHQPSSEIYKMFDKVIILDQGGNLAWFGNPIDAVVYFKTFVSQVNSTQGECPLCGNATPEIIFDIIEDATIDESGEYTEKRRVEPAEWAAAFNAKYPYQPLPEVKEPPLKSLDKPSSFRQFAIYIKRDFKSKIVNRQYVLLTLFGAPLLGFLLSFIIRYIPNSNSTAYLFSENENIPIYIFMSVIVALFLGLTMSAEEILRDCMILQRERFLNLSRSSYLLSKVGILIIISAIQSLFFITIGNSILGIKGLYFNYWLAFFATAFCANMIGLNISAAFNSAITIYIVIPLLIIPMMVLSGAMFPFDKLNRLISSVDKVPVIAELTPTKWAYEALMVSQFKDNKYSKVQYTLDGKTYFRLQMDINNAEFNKTHRITAIREALEITNAEFNRNPANRKPRFTKLELLKNELSLMAKSADIGNFAYIANLTPEKFNMEVSDSVTEYLAELDRYFGSVSSISGELKDKFYNANSAILKNLEDENFNYKLNEIVTKPYERKKILEYKNRLVQNTNPIYLEPQNAGFLNFRTHFFAPSKYIFGVKVDTFTFNITIVALFSLIFYLLLYYNTLNKIIKFLGRLKNRKIR